MRAIVITPVGLILSLAISSQLVAGKGEELRALCNNKDIDLTTVTKLKTLVDKIYSTDESIGCSAEVTNGLHALNDVVQAGGDEACSMEKALAIKKFADRFFHTEKGTLPKALARFAKSYGMKVAGTCRKHMLTKFLAQSDKELSSILGESEFKEFKRYLVWQSSLGQALEPILKQSDVLLPSDFAEVVPQFNENFEKFITEDAHLGSFKRFCTKFLEPFYRPMMLPLAELSRAGFNHREFGSLVDSAWTNFLSNDNLKFNSKFWSIALFACEQLKLVEVDESSEKSSTQAPDSERVMNPLPDYIITEKVDDKIIKLADLSLKLDVLNYKGNRDELQRLEDKIRENSLSVYKQLSQKGMHKDYILGWLRKLVFAGKSKTDLERARDGLVKLAEKSRADSRIHNEAMFLSDVKHNFEQFTACSIGFFALLTDTCLGSMHGTSIRFLQRF